MGDNLYQPLAGGERPPRATIGGKGFALAELAELAADGDFDVAPFFVVRAEVFAAVVGEGGDPLDSIARVSLDDAGRAELAEALLSLKLGDGLLAVRSSAAAEDGSEKSFAGQFDTLLGVRGEVDAVADAIRAVWASAYSEHATAYAAGAGGRARMAVVVQKMVDPEVSGVAFSVDPVSGDASLAVLSCVYGLGEGLVSGELDADHYQCARSGEIRRHVAHKDRALRIAPDGGVTEGGVTAESADSPALSDNEVREIARVARFLEERFGAPQDVEFALVRRGEERRLVILQSRPVTTVDADAPRYIWDNSNIIESYSGVTTPLTFSFALEVYEEVYLQFCKLVGVPESMLKERKELFANMLGLARGRVYYNLLNWYRMLALLPGFQFNRGFMERMMGVREELPVAVEVPSKGGKLGDLLRLFETTLKLTREGRRIDRQVVRFHEHVNQALAPYEGNDLSGRGVTEMRVAYHRLEEQLLRNWQTPIVNDFLAMMFFGVLGKLAEKWIPSAPATLVNDLLCGEGGIISTEPARRVMELSQRVANDERLSKLFGSDLSAEALWERVRRDHPKLMEEIEAFVERFGDRCMEELKLETITLREDPLPILYMIRAYLASGSIDPKKAWEREVSIRREAEARVAAQIGGWRRRLFDFVLQRTRARVRDRENLRFDRTRVFGVVRRIFVALGEHYAAEGELADPRDVFYLERRELFGSSNDLDWQQITRERRALFDEYAATPAPPDRFETFGPASVWQPGALQLRDGAIDPDARELVGIGCCPGRVKAAVRVVRDPRDAENLQGRILVAERTDPGWTLLFPAVSGLLVQRGSLLSHSAIVAREMGIPCIVGIAGLLDIVEDGEEVEMDGSSGVAQRLSA